MAENRRDENKPSVLLIVGTICLFLVDNFLLLTAEFWKILDAYEAASDPDPAAFFIKRFLTSVAISLVLQALVVAAFLGIVFISKRNITLRQFFATACLAYALYLPLKLGSCAMMVTGEMSQIETSTSSEHSMLGLQLQPGESSFSQRASACGRALT